VKAAVQAALDIATTLNAALSAEWVKGHAALDSSPHAPLNRRADRLCAAHGKDLHQERLAARAAEL
jgi:ribonuclease HI